MKLIVHVGNHKTGSTAIQTAFSTNTGTLEANRILYPKTGLIQNAHHIIALSLRGDIVPGFDVVESLDILLMKLKEEIINSKANVVIISSEEFFLCSQKHFNLLKPLYEIFDSIEFVCVLRNQLQHIESGYKFSVLWDAISETKNFVDYLAINLSSEYHNYYQKIKELYEYRDIKFLSVLDFDSLIKEGKLIKNFCDALGLKDLGLHEINNNKSLTRMATLGLCLFNSKMIPNIERESFIRRIENIFPKKESLYSQNGYNEVLAKFEQSNIDLFNLTGIDLAKSIPKESDMDFGGAFFRPRDMAKLYGVIAKEVS